MRYLAEETILATNKKKSIKALTKARGMASRHDGQNEQKEKCKKIAKKPGNGNPPLPNQDVCERRQRNESSIDQQRIHAPLPVADPKCPE